jgi:hypothetical protein
MEPHGWRKTRALASVCRNWHRPGIRSLALTRKPARNARSRIPVTFPFRTSFSLQPACPLVAVIAELSEIRSQSSAYVVESHSSAVEPVAHSLTDHDLMLAVRDGELDALGELFERHHGPLFGFLSKLTGQRTAAEDITQIVFQRMLKYRHTYRDDGSFTAWMYHLARRCAA